MTTVNFVVPPLDPERFSGGILCILEYAKGFRSKGYHVNLIPLLPSSSPGWFRGDVGSIPNVELPTTIPQSIRSESPYLLPLEMLAGLYLIYARELLKREEFKADVTIATSCLTALPVKLYGSGRRFYFAQHFEPYFGIEAADSMDWWEYQALATYRLGLELLSNSSWLSGKLRQEAGVDSHVCPNAIDHEVFFGSPKPESAYKEIRVISYGGRLADWKGFREMAAAVRLTRERLPEMNVRWQVYGTSVLKPNNDVANYEDLGFLRQADLANAYRGADILLSASWYESFPLFPLEAMACGLPVITTQHGTEEYAIHGDTAEVVQPRDAHSISAGLIRLITDSSYRSKVAAEGNRIAKKFTWAASVNRMEKVILGAKEISPSTAVPAP